MVRKQPEVTARTRRALMDAFWGLYVKVGRTGVTAGAVARIAGVSRGTFYQYFSDCDDVLGQIEDELLREIRDDIAGQISVGEPIALADLTHASARLFQRYEDRLLALLGERGDPAFPRRLVDELKPLLLTNIGLAANDPRVGLITEFCMNGMVAVLRSHAPGADPDEVEQLFSHMQTLMVRGIQGLAGDAMLIR